ncbi:MAG: response regulator [Halioglobus sp.]
MREPQTILICDDDYLVRELAARALESHQYRCLAACSEHEAMELFDNQRVDVVLMDIYLGEGNGIDCVRRIRALPSGKNVPVVFLTGSVDPLDVSACLDKEVNASAYLNKPLVWETLPALCNSLITSAYIQEKLYDDSSSMAKLEIVVQGIHHVGRMLEQVVTSEEDRALENQDNSNLAVHVQLRVACAALGDLEIGLKSAIDGFDADPTQRQLLH